MASINFSGLVSGLDTEAIISATISAKRMQLINPLNKKIDQNSQQNNALNALNERILTLFNEMKNKISAVYGGIDKKVNISDPTAMNVTATSQAPVMNMSLEVNQLATSGGIAFTSRYADYSEPMFPTLSGTSDITFLLGAAVEPITVTVDDTTTLVDLNDLVTEASSGKIHGAIINVGTSSAPSYAFMVTTSSEGTELGSLDVVIPSEIAATNNLEYNPLDDTLKAKDAILTIAGIGTVIKSSNTISDLFPGVTIELQQTTTDPVTLSTTPDMQSTQDLVKGIVDKINDMILFSQQYSTMLTGTDANGESTLAFGALAQTRIDEQLISSIKSALSGVRSGATDSSVNILADLGITTKRDGTLEFKPSDFTDAFKADGEAGFMLIQNLIDKLGETGSVLDEYSKTTGIIAASVKSTESTIQSLQDSIAKWELLLENQETSMRMMFTRLESTMARLNSNSQALTSLFSTLDAQKKS